MEPSASNAGEWAHVLQTTGGWGVAVIVGAVLGFVVFILARRYENHINESEKLFRSMIKDQTELLTQNKVQNEQMVVLMTKVNDRLDTTNRS